MKSKTTFPILVGGPSGVGKSALVNELTSKHPQYFARPKSYTTRTKRSQEGDEEYVFVTEEEYNQLKAESVFVNDDQLYSSYYATARSSIDDLIKRGKYPIKEIHPNNFYKFLKLYPNALTILILPLDRLLIAKSKGLTRDSDNSFYNKEMIANTDIIQYNDFKVPIQELGNQLFNTIMALISFEDVFPRPSLIDKLNQLGYDMVAREFSESLRITTSNFHIVSESFFKEAIKGLVKTNDRILEIGPGAGWLKNTVKFPKIDYTSIDISVSMMMSHKINAKVASARATGFPFSYFDCVFGALADPYFYPTALREIWRILKPGGHFILSIPSSKWSYGIREQNNKTKFILKNGKEAEVYSFTFTLIEVLQIAKVCGYSIIRSEEKTAESLLLSDTIVSPIIINASKINNVRVSDLILVNNLVLKKTYE